MIFDDIFYPGNPKRRDKISELRAKIIDAFESYKSAWNENAQLLTKIFSESAAGTPYENMKITLLTRDIREDTVDECLSEMQAALDDTEQKIQKIVDDIGISNLIPDWSSKDFKIEDLNQDIILSVGKALSSVLGSAAGGFVGYCVFVNISFAITWKGFLAGAVSSIGSILGGAVGGIIAGGAAFLITDMISSAITGAIERKELNDAIDALNKLYDAVYEPLMNGRDNIRGMIQSIKDGIYSLGDDWYIIRKKSGYKVAYMPDDGEDVVMDFIKAA